MSEHRLTVASMLLIAFLNLGGAQAAGEMPAELEINLDRVTQKGLGHHIKGTIPLQLPDGDESFVVEEVMRSEWSITCGTQVQVERGFHHITGSRKEGSRSAYRGTEPHTGNPAAKL